jgi:hypothetical protein
MRITPEYIDSILQATSTALGPRGTTGFLRTDQNYREPMYIGLNMLNPAESSVIAWLTNKNVNAFPGNTILAYATFASYAPISSVATSNYRCYVKINFDTAGGTSTILFSAYNLLTNPGEAPPGGALTGTFMLPITFEGYLPIMDVIPGGADWY